MNNEQILEIIWLVATIYAMIILGILVVKTSIYLSRNLLDKICLNLRLLGNIALVLSNLFYFIVNILLYFNNATIYDFSTLISILNISIICSWDFITLLLIRLWLSLFFQVSYEEYKKLRIYLIVQIIIEIIFVICYVIFAIINAPIITIFNLVVIPIFINGLILIYLIRHFHNYSCSSFVNSTAGETLKIVGSNIVMVFALLSVGFISVLIDILLQFLNLKPTICMLKFVVGYAISTSTNCIGLFIAAKTINLKESKRITPVSSIEIKQVTVMVNS